MKSEARNPTAIAVAAAVGFRVSGFVRSLLLLAAFIVWAVAQHCLSAPAALTFFVATNGNDSWSGSLPSPDRRKTDGPFASVERALDAVRNQRTSKTNLGGVPANISIRAGTFFLSKPIVLEPQDSGLVLAGYRKEQPILSGGRRIGGLRESVRDGKRIWTAEVPEVRQGRWFFHALWVDGKRAVRSRHPKHGYLNIAELPDKTPEWTQGHTRFRFREGDLKAWPSVTNAEIIVMTRWVESRLPIVGVDEKEGIVRFSKRSVFELAPNDLYYAEGALDFLEKPGEWCLDRAAAILYYLPSPGQTLQKTEIIAPLLPTLLRFEGEPEAGRFIEGVTLRGVTFANTEWNLPDNPLSAEDKPDIWPEPKPEIGGFGQAAVGVPGAVRGQGLRACRFENCRFVRLGNYGLQLTSGCVSNRVAHCEFGDLGAGGIKLGETRIRAVAREQTYDNEISDCHTHDGGETFHSAVGVWLGQTAGNRLLRNLIHDFYYTGISIGWTWGYGPSLATNNLIARNHVHHIGITSDGDGPILSDMGGIYTLGREPGTVIRNNLWHDIAGLRYGGWGIYFDEGSSGIVAENNVVYRTTHGGFHQHYGETNILRNNIFAFARDHQLQRTRPELHSSFSFQTNIVFFDSGVLLGGDWAGGRFDMDHNLYFDTRPGITEASFSVGPKTWAQWREGGHDQNSMIADPRFIAADKHDFRLGSASPALTLGFRAIDLKDVHGGTP